MTNLLKRGFTLIELLVVISIIGILTALITTNLQGARIRARDARRKGDLQAISQSLRLYYTDHQGFPGSTSEVINGCGDLGTDPCSWGGAFRKNANTIYMGSLPEDPSSTTTTPAYYKYYSTNGNSFTLVATLENLSDTAITESQTRCANSLNGHTLVTATDYIVCAE